MDQTQYNTKINGCDTRSYSKMSKKCRDCDKKDYCNPKRLEALAYTIPKEITISIDLASGKEFSLNTAGVADRMGWTASEAAEKLAKAMRQAALDSTPESTP